MEEIIKKFQEAVKESLISNRSLMVFSFYLLDKKGLTTLPENLLKDMIFDLTNRIANFVILKILDSLSDKSLKKLSEKIEKGKADPNEYLEFLNENLPNYRQIVKKALQDFEKIYLREKS